MTIFSHRWFSSHSWFSSHRRRGLALVVAATLALTGCTVDGADPAGNAGGGGLGAADAAVAAAFPGIYLPGDVVPVRETERGVELMSALPCAELGDILRAGQWRVVDELTLGGEYAEFAGFAAIFGAVPGMLLARGDSLAYAALTGEPTCTAHVGVATRHEVSVAGAGYPGAASAWVATPSCHRAAKGAVSVSTYFDTDSDVGGIVRTLLAPQGGTYIVDTSDETNLAVTLLNHSGGVLRAWSATMSGDSPEGVRLREFFPGEGFRGTAEVAGDELPTGTVTLAGLVDEEGEVTVTVPFACTLVTDLG